MELAKLWLSKSTHVWSLVRSLNAGVTLDSNCATHCTVGTKKLKLYPGCPTATGKILAPQLDKLVRQLIVLADPTDVLAGAFMSNDHTDAVANDEVTLRLSPPPFFTLAAACARPNLCMIPYGVWAAIRLHVEPRYVQTLCNAALTAQWVCDPYGQFVTFILNGGYSIGTGFTDTYVTTSTDIRIMGSTTGYIVSKRDKAMLILFCAIAPHVPDDTPAVILAAREALQPYI